MKSLKNWVVKTLSAVSLVLALSSTANATLITQDILIDGFFLGSLSVDTSNGVDIGGGLVEISAFEEMIMFDPIFSAFVPVDLLGPETIFLFNAVIDTNNLFGGIEFLEFDIESSNAFSYNGIFDAFAVDPAFDNFIDIFDTFGGGSALVDFGQLSLGNVTVPAPSAAILMALAIGGLMVRRRS